MTKEFRYKNRKCEVVISEDAIERADGETGKIITYHIIEGFVSGNKVYHKEFTGDAYLVLEDAHRKTMNAAAVLNKKSK